MGGDELVGAAPDGWRYTTLGAACQAGGGDIQTGPFGSQLHAADYVRIGVPSIMPQNIGDNRIVEDGIARITTDDAKRLSRYLVRSGDIVYSRRGDVERRALVREQANGWLCGTGCLRVRLGARGPDPCFTTYYLGHPNVREWIVRHAHGATMPNLNTAILSACPLLVPPPAEQRAIAHILGTLDDKIELNRRMNETLEAMARALFKSWFVDDAQGDELTFASVIDFKEGPGIMAIDFKHEGVPLIRLAGLEENSSLLSGCNYLDPQVVEKKWRLFRLRSGDTLLSTSASLGRVAVVSREAEGAIPYTGIIRMRPADGRLLPELIPYVLRSDHFQTQVESFGVGSVLRHFGPMHLRQMTVRIGPIARQREFVSRTAAVSERIEALRNESRTLAALRDTLLPKLISGELRVKDAERFVERAV